MKDNPPKIEELTPNQIRTRMNSAEREAMSAFLDFVQKKRKDNSLFYYTINFTTEGSFETHDCLLLQHCKQTNDVKKRIICEIKIRSKDYQTLLIEKQKFQGLLSFGNLFSDMTVLYINFTPAKTVVFDLIKLHNANKIRFIIENHNVMSYNKALGKTPKEIAYLNVADGKLFDFIYKPS